MTFREMGFAIGDKVRFVDDPAWVTRTILTEDHLEYDHLLPWILVKRARPAVTQKVEVGGVCPRCGQIVKHKKEDSSASR